ncbi:unnamed protein product [Didymodactylos carnosus]|uniref:Ammonium transporter n=1 Tax=Didymodactylos carnosus TaxID=1234261 RepID=A0A815C3V7_9BILA|nr:unnamed protein product [Didymodactylos carnosus]CAF4074837.1 unnamed protein product [Didymodactylos carnosus]
MVINNGSLYDSGDNAWMMTSTALVFMMTPALAFFYGGLVHHKNILNQLFLSIICMGIVLCQWILFGFSFAFGPGGNGGFGSFQWSVLRFGEGNNTTYSPTYPLLTFCAYEAAFAVITPALISGSIVGRMKLIPYMVFIFLWTTLCYDPLAHWVWAENGWLKKLGTLDFAGGTVVHISSGVSGYVASAIIGYRVDFNSKETGHNLPFTILGASLLWIGWIGFNAGSANAADGQAALAMINTNAAAASALMTWVVIDAIRGSVTVSGACIGVVVGLVSITPACGYVQPGWALLIGIIGCLFVYGAIYYKQYLKVDDALDVAVCHGLGGIIGAFCTGEYSFILYDFRLFTEVRLNPNGGANGMFYGRPIQLWYQVVGILTAIGFAAACTAGILLPMKFIYNIRVAPEDELTGLDRADIFFFSVAHGESWEGFTSLAVYSSAKMKEESTTPNGTFEMPYQPNNIREKTVAVKLTAINPLGQSSDKQILSESNNNNNHDKIEIYKL